MRVCYNKLWKILIDKNMTREDLRLTIQASAATMAKMGKNEDVSLDVLKRICKALNCNIGDIMDILPEGEE